LENVWDGGNFKIMSEIIKIIFAIVGIIVSVLAIIWILVDSYNCIASKRYKLLFARKSVIYIAGVLFAIHFIVEKGKILSEI
jgi:hypothetical protein